MLISDLQNGQVLVVGAGSSSFLVNFSDTVFIVFMMQKITNAIKRKLSTLVINEPHITLTPFITVDFSEKSSPPVIEPRSGITISLTKELTID